MGGLLKPSLRLALRPVTLVTITSILDWPQRTACAVLCP